jgi:acetate kinase
VKRQVGTYTAALSRLYILVFTRGIGEIVPTIRERICAVFGFLGLELDPQRNAEHAPLISPIAKPVIRVLHPSHFGSHTR